MRRLSLMLVAVVTLAGCGGGHRARSASGRQTASAPASACHGYVTPYGCAAHSPSFGLPPQGVGAPRPAPSATRTVEQFDSVTLSAIPSNAVAVAGYTSGLFPTFARLAALFPHAQRVSIAINASHIAKCLDIEPFDAVPSQAAGWLLAAIRAGIYHPCLYENGSELPAVLANLHAAHIARSSFLIWLADWTFHPGLRAGSDCTQWTDHALNRNLDESTCSASFYATRPAPKPKPARVICFGAHGTPRSKACKPVVALYVRRQGAAAASSRALTRARADLTAHGCRKPYRRAVCAHDGRTVRILSQRESWFAAHATSLRKAYS